MLTIIYHSICPVAFRCTVVLFVLLSAPWLQAQAFHQGRFAFAPLVLQSGDSSPAAREHYYYGWLQIGAGVHSEGYMAARLGLIGCMDNQLLMLRASGGGELSIFSTPANEYEEYGLLYGKRYTYSIAAAYIAAGPGYTVITQEHRVYHEPALLLEGSASLNLRYIGIALTGFLDVNPHQLYGGIVAELQLGYIQ